MRPTSAPFKRAAYRSQTDEAILLLLEISHPELAEPIRISSDAIDTAHGSAWLASFIRNFTAVQLDGSIVEANVPRYEAGQYGQAIMVGKSGPVGEALSIPASTLPINAGTFEIDVLVDAVAHSAEKTYAMAMTIRQLDLLNSLLIGKIASSTNWQFGTADSSTLWYSAPFAVAVGWRRFAVTWDKADTVARCYLDGILVDENLSAPLADNYATALGGVLSLGRYASNVSYLESLIDGVRISSRPRSAAELLAGMGQRLRLDDDTTTLLSFDGTLAAAARYVSFPFTLTLPDDRDDQVTTAKLAIDNVDRTIVRTIRSLSTPPTVTVKIVLASTPDVIEAGPIPFTLTGVTWDALTVEGSLGFADELLGQGYPAHAMTPQLFPGIFA